MPLLYRTGAQRIRLHRQTKTPAEKIKDKAKHAAYMRIYRTKASPMLKKNMTEQSRLRMAATRERRRKMPHITQVETRQTEQKKAEVREKWRIEKRAWRTKMKARPQKYRRQKEKDKIRKMMARRIHQLSESSEAESTDQANQNIDDDGQVATTSLDMTEDVENIDDGTPLHVESGLLESDDSGSDSSDPESSDSSVGDPDWTCALKDLVSNKLTKKSTVRVVSHKLTKRGQRKKFSRDFGVRYNTVLKHSKSTDNLEEMPKRKRRNDATPEEVVNNIQSFFQRSDISTTMPNAKAVTKDGLPKCVLQRTLHDCHDLYKKEYAVLDEQHNVGFSFFASCKPKNVKPTSHAKQFQCLCIYCLNIDLKLTSVNQACRNFGKQNQYHNRYKILDTTMCQKQNDASYHDLSCIKRECLNCPVGMPQINSALTDQELDHDVKWSYWGKDSGSPETSNRLQQIEKQTTLRELLARLEADLKPFSLHLFIARWQQEQFNSFLRRVPDGITLLVMDFSENYSFSMKYEPQSYHWVNKQITLFPVVCYYRCPEHPESVVTEAVHIITSDKQHDGHAVACFLNRINDHLRVDHGIKSQLQIQFSDGCSCQFKSKLPFSDISSGNEDFGYPIIRNFFGSCHGKSPSDGEGGVVKSKIHQLIKSTGIVINNASTFFAGAKVHLSKAARSNDGKCAHYRRSFILVTPDEIDRTSQVRKEREKVKTLNGTRQLHSVMGLNAGVVKVRDLTCLCDKCLSGDGSDSPCVNSRYIGPWRVAALKKQNQREEQSEPIPYDGRYYCETPLF